MLENIQFTAAAASGFSQYYLGTGTLLQDKPLCILDLADVQICSHVQIHEPDFVWNIEYE